MEYLTKIRNIRNILFKAFLINMVTVIVLWVFVMLDLMRYFMWALPGFTLKSANLYVMSLIGILDVAGYLLFLVPTIALGWEIWRTKRMSSKKK